jgi:hypothetical protein
VKEHPVPLATQRWADALLHIIALTALECIEPRKNGGWPWVVETSGNLAGATARERRQAEQ